MAKFLHILAHNVRNHTFDFIFNYLGETINCHFHQVMRVLITLEDLFSIQLDGSVIRQKYWIVRGGSFLIFR